MANPEHLGILKQGVEQWNKWRNEHPNIHPSLEEADLGGVNLAGDLNYAQLFAADLSHCNLRGALLHDANLSEAGLRFVNLIEADLRFANLSMADTSGLAVLRGANLTSTNMSQANLTDAVIIAVHFEGAELKRTNFEGTLASGTCFDCVDLSVADNLEAVRHFGRSTIGIDTLFKSHGKIPEIFLRGCGLQNWEIEFAKLYQPNLAAADLTTILYRVSELRSGVPVRYSSCFISYSTQDQEFADRLYADLQGNGVRCWFAPHDIMGGRKIHEQLDEAIRLHDKLLLILSEHSINSPWVKTEILRAQKRETEKNKENTHPSKPGLEGVPAPSKRVLFPITLVPYQALESWEYPISSGVDLAEEIRQYFIPDFSSWKDHDSYQAAFQRLVRDLKADAPDGANPDNGSVKP